MAVTTVSSSTRMLTIIPMLPVCVALLLAVSLEDFDFTLDLDWVTLVTPGVLVPDEDAVVELPVVLEPESSDASELLLDLGALGLLDVPDVLLLVLLLEDDPWLSSSPPTYSAVSTEDAIKLPAFTCVDTMQTIARIHRKDPAVPRTRLGSRGLVRTL